MPPVLESATESPVETQERVKEQLEASGQATGARRQLQIDREAGIPTQRVTADRFGEGTVPTAAEQQATTQNVTAAGNFVDLVRQKSQDKMKQRRDELLSAPQNFDTQIDLQRGALHTALVDQASALTPENLRWLTPQQQSAIRSGDKNLIKTAIIGLNSISQARAKRQEATQARKEGVLDFLSDNNLLGTLSEEQATQLETEVGLPVGTVSALAEQQADGQFTFEVRSLKGDRFLQLKKDARTGQIVGQEIITAGGGAPGVVSTTTTVTPEPEQALSFEEFRNLAITEGAFLGDALGSPTEETINALYQDYLAETGATTAPPQAPALAGPSDEDAVKLLSSTDKKKMFAQGLDPNNPSDARQYIQQNFSATTEVSPEDAAFNAFLGISE